MTRGVTAQAPQLINFQAQVEGISAATASVVFAIYDSPTSTTALWSESYPSLSVQNQHIQVLLGTNRPLDASLFETAGDRYLSVTVNGETLTPRSRLTSVAYALRAAVADRVAGGGSAGVASLNTLTGAVTLVGGDNVSINPDGQNLRIDATGGGGGGGITTINEGAGISISDSDGPVTEVSLKANAINDGYIVDNSLTALSLADNAVGNAEITDDAVGSNELAARVTFGPNGQVMIANPSGGARADLTTENGAGFLGLHQADDKDAVTLDTQNGAYGRVTVHNNAGATGARMWGELTDTDSKTLDPLKGGSIATYKRNGENSSVWIRTNGTNDTNSWGVIGVSDASNVETININGENGNISIAGNLSKGSGSFKIDHPLDPANKYLSHSFVESPDMMNIYNGNAILDDSGEAWIELPTWFEALNRDFRYQLTCIGGHASVYIAAEIENNRFKIGGGLPGLKVSWQVTGIRHDPYAERHRIKVEEEKEPAERGTYLHPQAYGVNE